MLIFGFMGDETGNTSGLVSSKSLDPATKYGAQDETNRNNFYCNFCGLKTYDALLSYFITICSVLHDYRLIVMFNVLLDAIILFIFKKIWFVNDIDYF